MKRSITVVGAAGLLLVGVVAGFLLDRESPRPAGAPPAAAPAERQQVWTCSMHPQVRLDRPGKCPICEMPLVPAGAMEGPADGAPVLRLSDHALAMASVETVAVERRELTREFRAVGKVEFNESSLATITPRVDGYAERLFVNFTGVQIKAGDHLVEVYSPELLVAQQELLIALQGGNPGALVETAKTKLKLLGLADSQVADLVEKKALADRITLYSPISGTVIEKLVVDQAAFKAGEPLYRIANLETVWVYVDVYEYDLPWIRYGQTVSITAEALPGETFPGMVTFVQPVVNDLTRTIRVPVHVVNADHRLKPGMFVSVVVHSALGADGRAKPTGVEGRHSCPMHPQVVEEAAGDCPICGMPLEKIPGAAAVAAASVEPAAPAAATFRCPMKCEKEKVYEQPGKCPVCGMALKPVETVPAGAGSIAVPVAAVLDSGTRKLVFVEKSKGLFESREVACGPRAGDYFPVLEGLAAGERVVTRGGFLLDSQFQITGHPSLLHPGGLHASMGHPHGGAPTADPPPPPPEKPDPHAGHER